MHDVFISYSSLNKPVADAICHHLEDHGIKCWYAPRDIPAGEEWQSAIVRAIRASRVFVLLYSRESNNSKQVLREVSVAVEGGCVIIPFRMDESRIEDGLSYYLTSLHWLDAITPPLEWNIDTLYRRVCAVLQMEAAPREDDPVPPVPRKRWKIIALAVVLCAAIGLGAAYFVGREPAAPEGPAAAEDADAAEGEEIQHIEVEDISLTEEHRYPFYHSNMFAAYLDSYYMESLETGKLFHTKTDTDSFLQKDIDFTIDDATAYTVCSLEHYNVEYFVDGKANTIRSYDKVAGEWICKEPVSMGLAEYEMIAGLLGFNDYLLTDVEHHDEVVVLVYDSRPEFGYMTKAITFAPDGTFQTTDISPYRCSRFLSGLDREDNTALLLDSANRVVVFDFMAMQPVAADAETLLETYMPDKVVGPDVLSPSGRYLMTGENNTVSVWDLLEGKRIFTESFTRNYACYFQSDRELVYYNGEDGSVHVRDLETGRATQVLPSLNFVNGMLDQDYLDIPFAFAYDETLEAYMFISRGKEYVDDDAMLFQLTITDTEGKVLACSKPVEEPFEEFWVEIHNSGDALLLFCTCADEKAPPEDGVYTHVYRTRYGFDSEGNVQFTDRDKFYGIG